MDTIFFSSIAFTRDRRRRVPAERTTHARTLLTSDHEKERKKGKREREREEGDDTPVRIDRYRLSTGPLISRRDYAESKRRDRSSVVFGEKESSRARDTHGERESRARGARRRLGTPLRSRSLSSAVTRSAASVSQLDAAMHPAPRLLRSSGRERESPRRRTGPFHAGMEIPLSDPTQFRRL